MLARNDVLEYVLENYGHCDRDNGKQNDCYWGKDALGRENGCLKTGWRGRNCKHWHPVDGQELMSLIALHSIKSEIA